MAFAALKALSGLADQSHSDLILLFGWHLHVHKKKPHFTGADIAAYYRDLHLSAPSSFGGYFKNLMTKKELLKTTGGYKLESKVRARHDAAYGQSEVTVKVAGLLQGLADTIPDMAARAYYKEALICYHHGSLRGAVVMTWNVAYSHLCTHVISQRLADFNARWQVSMPGMHKNRIRAIAKSDDFNDELKEAEVIAICRDAAIITRNMFNILHASLGKRNAAAHPNAVVIDQLQTDAFIVDLITNVVQQIA